MRSACVTGTSRGRLCLASPGAAVVATLAVTVFAAYLRAGPTITITHVHDYGVNGDMQGGVTGVDFATHRFAPYIQIEGAGWWTKPTFVQPTGAIDPDGTGLGACDSSGLAAAVERCSSCVGKEDRR